MRATWRRLALPGCLLLAASLAQAQSDPDADPSPAARSWRLSGFGTLGVVHTDADHGWLFARDTSQKGAGASTSAMPDSRLGLQLNWQMAANWEAVLQAVVRQRPPHSDVDEMLEMGFVAWRPGAGWTLRAGRIKPDLFLLHNSRNVGYSMPWVRPSAEFYGWIPGASMDGGTVAYAWSDSRALWNAQMWVGELHNNTAALRTDGNSPWRGRNTIALTLTREAGGLALKASIASSDTDLGQYRNLQPLEAALLGIAQIPLPPVATSAAALYDALIPDGRTRYFGLGAEYDSGTWLASAELSRVTMERGLAGGTHGYASIGRRFGMLTAYAMAGFSQPQRGAPRVQGDWATSLAPLIGVPDAQAAAMAGAIAEAYAADARFDQRSVTVGLRWDVFDRVALKAQLDHVRVDAYGAGQWRHSTTDAGRANQLSLAVDWVF